MANKSYSELLKDPRWQKKRLEIMQRDDFKCRSCEMNDRTLHVHHLKYEKGLNPWESDNDDLITLCDCCHEALHYLQIHPTIGLETFSCVMQLCDRLESESIEKYFFENEKLHIKNDGEF